MGKSHGRSLSLCFEFSLSWTIIKTKHQFLCKLCFSSHIPTPIAAMRIHYSTSSLMWKICFCLCLTPTPGQFSPIHLGSNAADSITGVFISSSSTCCTPTIVLGNARIIFHQDYWIIFFQEKWKCNIYLQPLPANESKGKCISNSLSLCYIFPLDWVLVLSSSFRN